MKILGVGDLHLNPNKLNQSVSLLEWLRIEIDRLRPDLIVHLGDTFNTHAILRTEVLSLFNDYLLETSRLYSIIHLLGNHEMIRPDVYAHHALKTLRCINNVQIIDAPRVVDGITFVPYVHDSGLFPKITTQLAFAHQTFLGSQYSGFRPKEGVEVANVGCELVISGHIHERQMFDSVIYPGTPIATSASDINQDKGIILFDTDTFRYEFIDSPFPRYKEHFIDEHNTALPPIDGSIYVVRLTGSKSFCSSFLASKDVKVRKDCLWRAMPHDAKKNLSVAIKARKNIKDMAVEYAERVLQTPDQELLSIIRDL